MKLILASRSPRRRFLLKAAGLSFSVLTPHDVHENPRKGESPKTLVCRLAGEKALAVAEQRPGYWVVGCDTEVILNGKVLGKPANKVAAKKMLRSLEGRTHVVISGIAWVDSEGGLCDTECVESRVTFSRIPKEELESYINSKEPYDKAGGYGIQGPAAKWVKNLEGDYFNVMGLPVTRVWKGLMRFGAFSE